jgi:hypothetical protein
MRRLREKLTYANVMVTVLAFVVLGGSAYAATQLPKDSVGTAQIKKGAVTPGKLSATAKATLIGPQGLAGQPGAAGATGAAGPAGPEGAKAADGGEGPRGADGVGAITVEATATASGTKVSFGGFEVQGFCTPQGSEAEIQIESTEPGLQMFGTVAEDDPSGEVTSVDVPPQGGEPEAIPFQARGSSDIVNVDLDVRNATLDKAWTRIDLRLSAEDCLLTGTAIPSTAG